METTCKHCERPARYMVTREPIPAASALCAHHAAAYKRMQRNGFAGITIEAIGAEVAS